MLAANEKDSATWFDDVSASLNRNELVVVVGSGISSALTEGRHSTTSWRGLIADGFRYATEKGRITAQQYDFWANQLASEDIDDLLSSAEFVGRKLGAPAGDLYARWIKDAFKRIHPTDEATKALIRSFASMRVPICTLNYDTLLESVTGLNSIDISDFQNASEWMRRDQSSILHIHGCWKKPSSCILGIRDYEATLSSESRDLIQRSLAAFRHFLFLGCGDTFADPNFSALISWLRLHVGADTPQHYALVTSDECAHRQSDASWQGFVEPISYGTHHSDLGAFLQRHFADHISPGSIENRTRADVRSESELQTSLLSDYCEFLVKDCGQMTIEGVRADLDTAQRKFDLERLFVPLNVAQCPPEFPPNDPESSEKFDNWLKLHGNPKGFGEILEANPRIALLALPGGGKSLLLKRLAVAYASNSRRSACADGLPALEVVPVLIRCREWREHIHKPIVTLLRSLPAITGQPSLEGIDKALLKRFAEGSALLLVDGIDEIHDDSLREIFVGQLERFFEDFPEVRLVATSREAGFELVAPPLSRFCSKWKIASLGSEEIISLCSSWHRLMNGDSAEALAESDSVAQHLLKDPSLRRLAENPLLLTMLLVVKHGAGRLPPDRVSLYERAVEVLLDTWNIKGHEPLNLKEAVPQLACVAFELMVRGQQTATEKQLLLLLEEARERVPQIRRYAKGTPQDFLRRVELRSSLLLEGGHLEEDGRTVPFYQFRHLTFQEYLSAVAAAEGHYMHYQKGDTVLTPLLPFLSSEEWKEVVPMAAVVAKKQAEPLISELVSEGDSLLAKTSTTDYMGPVLPTPVARLLQSLIEESEASPETLAAALRLIAIFARGCQSAYDWGGIVRGPYGRELLHQSWLRCKYEVRNITETDPIFTYSVLSSLSRNKGYWSSPSGKDEIKELLSSDDVESRAYGIAAIAGTFRTSKPDERRVDLFDGLDMDAYLLKYTGELFELSNYAWTLDRIHSKKKKRAPLAVLDKLLTNLLQIERNLNIDAALCTCYGMPRNYWGPKLSESEIQGVRQVLQAASFGSAPDQKSRYEIAALALVAYHSKKVLPDAELAAILDSLEPERLLHFGTPPTALELMLDNLRKSPSV